MHTSPSGTATPCGTAAGTTRTRPPTVPSPSSTVGPDQTTCGGGRVAPGWSAEEVAASTPYPTALAVTTTTGSPVPVGAPAAAGSVAPGTTTCHVRSVSFQEVSASRPSMVAATETASGPSRGPGPPSPPAPPRTSHDSAVDDAPGSTS